MNKFYPCLICDTTEKSIQTFFCRSCETTTPEDVRGRYIKHQLEKENNNETIN